MFHNLLLAKQFPILVTDGFVTVCLKIEDTNSYFVLGKCENHPLKLGVPDFQTIPDVLFPMLINRGVPPFKQPIGK